MSQLALRTTLAALTAALLSSAPADAQQGGGPSRNLADNVAELQAKTTLSDLDCIEGEIPAFDGTDWVCVDAEPATPVFYTNSRDVTLPTDPSLPVALTNLFIGCSRGDAAVSGGYEVAAGGFRFPVQSYPSNSGEVQGWRLGLQSLAGAVETTATIYVRCLDLTP